MSICATIQIEAILIGAILIASIWIALPTRENGLSYAASSFVICIVTMLLDG